MVEQEAALRTLGMEQHGIWFFIMTVTEFKRWSAIWIDESIICLFATQWHSLGVCNLQLWIQSNKTPYCHERIWVGYMIRCCIVHLSYTSTRHNHLSPTPSLWNCLFRKKYGCAQKMSLTCQWDSLACLLGEWAPIYMSFIWVWNGLWEISTPLLWTLWLFLSVRYCTFSCWVYFPSFLLTG